MFGKKKKEDTSSVEKTSSEDVSSFNESSIDKTLADPVKVEKIKEEYDKSDRIDLTSDETIEIQVIRKLTGGFFKRKKEQKERANQLKRASIERFHPSIKLGLSTEMVNHRIQDGMTNTTPKTYTNSVFKIIIKNSFTYFNILMLALAIVLIVVHSHLSNFFFAAIAVFNLIIGTVQEIRAKQVTDRMSLIVSPRCTVIRNGSEEDIKEADIVLDDIIVVSSGRQVSADCIVKEGMVEANESMQTGESKPIKKKSGDKLLAGSFIVSGTAYAQVEAVGEDSFSGSIQKTAKTYKKVTSPLNHTINALIQIISFLVLPLGALMFYVNYKIGSANGNFTSIYGLFNFAVEKTASSMIGMIPFGLVLLTSVALTVGVIRLSKRKVLIQDLYSIERLARVNCICFDKTGTLTDGTLKLEKTIKADDRFDLEKTLGSYLSCFKETNQTSLALLKEFTPNSILTPDIVLPFSSSRKISAVSFSDGDSYALGAPEYLLDFSKPSFLIEKIKEAQNNGFRSIAFCQIGGIKNDKVTGKITPKAIFIISDHIREEASDTVRWFKESQVEIKVISGDSPITVSNIAKKVGIDGAEKYVSLEGLSLGETKRIASEYTVFGRVSPEQKAALIQELKAQGKKVAMTGDGVNDILAMKQADCSVAMASGADATRSAAHVILLNSDFSSMPGIVNEGRRAVNNIQLSASLFTMKAFFTILLSLFVDVCFFCKLGMSYPFSPRNLAILEFIPIGMCAFFLALQPNSRPIGENFGKKIIIDALPGALAMFGGVAACMLLFNKGTLTDKEAVLSLEILSINTAAFLILLKICLPFNLYRGILFFGSIAAAVSLLFGFSTRSFGVDFSILTEFHWLTFLYISLGMAVIIFVSGLIITRIKKGDPSLADRK